MVVQARLNGNHPPNYHPNLPVTIQALVGDGRQVVAAGANELHIHIRDEKGLESLHPDRVDATMRALKTELPGTLIGSARARRSWRARTKSRSRRRR